MKIFRQDLGKIVDFSILNLYILINAKDEPDAVPGPSFLIFYEMGEDKCPRNSFAL